MKELEQKRKRGRPRKTQVYLTSDEIYETWSKWQSTGIVSDEMAKQMLTLATHMLMMPQFNGYSRADKDEMIQEACLKIIRNLHNMKEGKRKGFFSYWSCCCYSAFVTYLRKHYKRTNEHRQYLLDTLQAASDMGIANIRPDIIRNLRDNIALYNKEDRNNEIE